MTDVLKERKAFILKVIQSKNFLDQSIPRNVHYLKDAVNCIDFTLILKR